MNQINNYEIYYIIIPQLGLPKGVLTDSKALVTVHAFPLRPGSLGMPPPRVP